MLKIIIYLILCLNQFMNFMSVLYIRLRNITRDAAKKEKTNQFLWEISPINFTLCL